MSITGSMSVARSIAVTTIVASGIISVLLGSLEAFAVGSGIVTVWLLVRLDPLNWPIGIASSAVFGVVFLDAGLYADAVLQLLYVALGVYGWWYWLFGRRVDGTPVQVSHAPRRILATMAIGAIAASGALAMLLDRTTDSSVPFPDALTTTLSIVAQFLLTRKYVETWPVWILGVNLPYIALYGYKGLFLTMALQFVYIALSAAGWRSWARALPDEAAPVAADIAKGEPTT